MPTFHYKFSGIIFPPGPEPLEGYFGCTLNNESVNGPVQIHARLLSQTLVVDCEAQSEIEDMPTFKHVLEGYVQDELNALAFVTGLFYWVELTNVVLPNGQDAVFGHPGNLIAIVQPFLLAPGELSGLAHQDAAFRDALRDLQMAIFFPEEAAYLCFRAIERIRDGITSPDQEEKGIRWEKMHLALGTARTEFDTLKKAADSTRHGENIRAPWTDRQAWFEAAVKVVNQYRLWKAQPP